MRFKYFLGRVVALLALLVLWPLLLVIALLVKLKMSDGPVLFRQQRVGPDDADYAFFEMASALQTG